MGLGHERGQLASSGLYGKVDKSQMLNCLSCRRQITTLCITANMLYTKADVQHGKFATVKTQSLTPAPACDRWTCTGPCTTLCSMHVLRSGKLAIELSVCVGVV